MGSLHNVYVYQITTVYTLTILQFYMSIRYITNSELKKKEREKEVREWRKGKRKDQPQRKPCSTWPYCIAAFLGHVPGEEEEAASAR